MFEQILIKYGMVFAINLIVSIVLCHLISYRASGPFHIILLRLFFLGVIVHEISHFIANLAVGVVPKNIKVKFRDEKTKRPYPHGSVETSLNNTFLQTTIIGLAPLFVSTWLIYLSLEIALSSQLDPLLRILAGFFCVSLFLGAAPSKVDFLNIPRKFMSDPAFSTYQLFLLILSISCSWILIDVFHLVFDFEIVYFLIVGAMYFGFKFGFKGARWLFYSTRSSDFKRPRTINYKRYARRKIRPSKPERLGFKPTRW